MNSLINEQVSKTLVALHVKADADHITRLFERKKAAKDGTIFNRAWDTAYMAVDREEGNFLYFLATVTKAKKIVEFGCSFGISTIYLAAAAKDNGGSVVTTDLEPGKVAGAKQNITAAGLSDFVEILQGDAIQTLAHIEEPIDFLFLDGAKELYLPVFEMLRSKLAKGAIVFADNTDKPETKAFVDFMLNLPTEFTAIYLFDNRALIAYLN